MHTELLTYAVLTYRHVKSHTHVAGHISKHTLCTTFVGRSRVCYMCYSCVQFQSAYYMGYIFVPSGIKSGIGVRELISTLKKKAQAGNEWLNIL